MPECETQVLAFNLNTLTDSKSRPLPELLLAQYYQSRGYCANFIYAHVIESELDKLGKLDSLHAAVEEKAGIPWSEIKDNPTFYKIALYSAVCEIAPDQFPSHNDVDNALDRAMRGELRNAKTLIKIAMQDMKQRETQTNREQRLLFVLDESGHEQGKGSPQVVCRAGPNRRRYLSTGEPVL